MSIFAWIIIVDLDFCMVYSESEIVHELEAGNEVCLNMLFDNYYRALCVYALRFVSNADDVEDIVQEVFVS